MSGKHEKRCRRIARLKRNRITTRQRLWITEQLEVRAAPGSMLVEVLTFTGHSMIRPEQTQGSAADQHAVAATKGLFATMQQPSKGRSSSDAGQEAQQEREEENSRVFHARQGKTVIDSAQSPHREQQVTVRHAEQQGGKQPRHESASQASPPWLSESTLLVTIGLEDVLGELPGGDRPTSRPGGGSAPYLPHGFGAGSASSQSPAPTLNHELANSVFKTPRGDPLDDLYRGERSGLGSFFAGPGLSLSAPPNATTDAEPTAPTGFAAIPPTASAATTETLSVVASDDGIVSNGQTTQLGSHAMAPTISLGFDEGLTNWNIHEVGGSPNGRGQVTQGSAILHEGDSFLVTIDRQFNMAALPLSLSFTYEAVFDMTDPDFVNDAFEAALLDAEGFSLVNTFHPQRDSYFNLTEGLPAALGDGVIEEEVPLSEAVDGVANRVSVDLTDVPTSGEATLVFRLVNNDADTETYVRIFDVDLVQEDTCSIGGYVYLDVNNNGIMESQELALPNVPITLTGDMNTTTVTNADGWYEFTDLPPGTYDIIEAQPTAFLDGLDTPGTPVMGHTANDMFYAMQIPAQMQARNYNFGELGLIPELVSKKFFLALTPDGQELLSTIMAQTGEGWFTFTADAAGELVVNLDASIDGLKIELYSDEMIPIALARGESAIAAPVAEGENYVLHIAGQTGGDELVAHLAIRPRLPWMTAHKYALDVNVDGYVSPLDALLVINQLNGERYTLIASGSQRLMLDVNRDDLLSPLDALLVINHLNQASMAEGESAGSEPTDASDTVAARLCAGKCGGSGRHCLAATADR